MQVNSTNITTQKSLLLSVIGIGLLIVVATSLGKESAKIVTDVVSIPIAGSLVALSLLLALRFKRTGTHGKAWLFFLGLSVSWFIAETLWAVLELVYNMDPFPSLADVFYLAGYPFLMCFLIYYINPVKKAATRKMLVAATVISVSMMFPSVYMAYDSDPKVSIVENIIATSYPIMDSIIFIPALIGVILFFRGEVNFTWSLVCIAIILNVAGDTAFQIATFTDTYYTGHPADILLLWSYVFFSFGVYDHIRIFRKPEYRRTKSELT